MSLTGGRVVHALGKAAPTRETEGPCYIFSRPLFFLKQRKEMYEHLRDLVCPMASETQFTSLLDFLPSSPHPMREGSEQAAGWVFGC